MSKQKQRLRQLPPSAVPVSAADLGAGLRGPADANREFRSALAAYFGTEVEACRLASSGRTIVYTLLKGLAEERKPRRQVVMPAYTCPVLPKVALDLGLDPVYGDIDPQTTQYQPGFLADIVGEDTLAVFHVHPFGIPLSTNIVLNQAQEVGAAVIEDAAQAMGARWDGRPVGLAGDFGLFSLGPGKPLSTGGGGIAISSHEALGKGMASWWANLPRASGLGSAQAWLRQAAFRLAFHPHGWWAATRLGLQRLGNQEESWGYAVRGLSDAQARIGLALLPRLNGINKRRREVAGRLATAVENAQDLQLLTIEAQAEPIFLRLPLLAANESRREALFEALWSAGIGAGRMYEKTLPAIFDPERRDDFPGAEDFARRLLTLPTHYHVSEDDIVVMEEILAKF